MIDHGKMTNVQWEACADCNEANANGNSQGRFFFAATPQHP